MKIQALLIYIILSTFNLSLANCIENPLESSGLPKDMPENTVIKYSGNGGMAPAWYRVEITEQIMTVEDKKMGNKKANRWYAEITKAEKEAVYKVFVENKFDLVKNEKRQSIVYDAPSERISLRAGKLFSKGISYGANSRVSPKNAARLSAIETTIKNLAEKHTSTGKPISDKFAVMSYRKKEHSAIFKDAKRTKLSYREIDKLSDLLGKAVQEHNKTPRNRGKIADFEKYKHQLIPTQNDAGDKIVWVNSVCSAGREWKRRVLLVADGGSCYFNLYINLTKNNYDRFSVNGEA